MKVMGFEMEPSDALRMCDMLRKPYPACPSCGEENVVPIANATKDGEGVLEAYVFCGCCGKRTGVHPDEAGAAVEWNADAKRSLVDKGDYWFSEAKWGVPDVRVALRRCGYACTADNVAKVLGSKRFEKTLQDRLIEEGQDILLDLVDTAMEEE